jgi:hypothetical protein
MCRGAAANVAHAKENNVEAWSKHSTHTLYVLKSNANRPLIKSTSFATILRMAATVILITVQIP